MTSERGHRDIASEGSKFDRTQMLNINRDVAEHTVTMLGECIHLTTFQQWLPFVARVFRAATYRTSPSRSGLMRDTALAPSTSIVKPQRAAVASPDTGTVSLFVGVFM